jgi:hypothetical protein
VWKKCHVLSEWPQRQSLENQQMINLISIIIQAKTIVLGVDQIQHYYEIHLPLPQ